MTSDPFITIFTAPKPFRDPHIALIQRNAIRSWLAIGGEAEVFLVGDETGLAETAHELGVIHLPEVRCSPAGTPLVSSIFETVRRRSRAALLLYVNADILLRPDILAAGRAAHKQTRDFLLIGRRWDLLVADQLDFSAGWPERLAERAQKFGRLHPPAGSDYFLFPRSLFSALPDFTIGRAGWDNWMIFHALRQGWSVIDATPDVMIVHQNHDYRHLGGRPHYDHPESQANVRLARGESGEYTGYLLLDSDRELRDGRVERPRPTLARWLRRLEMGLRPAAETGLRWELTRRIRRMRRRLTAEDS